MRIHSYFEGRHHPLGWTVPTPWSARTGCRRILHPGRNVEFLAKGQAGGTLDEPVRIRTGPALLSRGELLGTFPAGRCRASPLGGPPSHTLCQVSGEIAPESPKRHQGRPRSSEVHDAVINATIALLTQAGYPGLSIERIAATAGVGKRTIYRWWPSKGALVAEAYTQLISDRHPDPDTGSVRRDLHVMMSRLFRGGRHPQAGAVLRSMMIEAQRDEQFATEFQTFIADRRRVLSTVLQRGIDRGELRVDTNLDVAVDALFGPFWYRLLSPHAPLSEAFAQDVVDQLLSGLAAKVDPLGTQD